MAPRINIPPLTRGLVVGLIVLSLLNIAVRYRSWAPDRSAPLSSRQYYAPFLTIVPGVSVRYPWVFVTATLVEQNIVGLLLTAATLFYSGRYLERAWSSTEYTKFIMLCSVVPNLFSFLVYISLFRITRNAGFAYVACDSHTCFELISDRSTSINGGIALQAAFLVSFKQLIPEHTVAVARGLIRVRVKHFPSIFLIANTISGLAFGTDTAMLLSWLGFFTAWTYLRFYRKSPALTSSSTGDGLTLRGDPSDTFAFACFFPDVVQPPVAAVGNAVYHSLVALRLCTPFSAEDVDAGNEQATARGEGGLPSLLNPGGRGGRGGGRREEAERRRALALRALDQRLQTTTTVRPHPIANGAIGGETTYEIEPHDQPSEEINGHA